MPDRGPHERGAPGAAEAAPSLDDVRGELRSLGYLKDPIAGLIVPHSTARATFLRVSLLTSLRSGILGAAILAAPLAFTLARLSRPHVQGGRDLAVLTLYLLPLLAGALGAMNLLGDLCVRLIARRRGFTGMGERLAARLGAILGGASSLYLALLWGRQDRRDAGAGILAVEILVIAAAGWLVGWIMRGGAIVVVAALGGRLGGGSRARASIPVLLAALLGALALLGGALMSPPPRAPRPMPNLTALPVPGRLIVVGVDGIDADWLDTLLSRLDLPVLREVTSRGASWRLRPYRSPLPPEVWTTIATGVSGEVHGVRSFEFRRLPGMQSPLLAGPGETAVSATLGSALKLLAFLGPEAPAAPLSSSLRRSRAIWEVMNAAGAPACAINWWGTWPAQAEGGMTVSDRALGAFLKAHQARAAPAHGGEGIKDDGLVHPPALLHELETEFSDRWAALEGRFRVLSGKEAPGSREPALHEAFLIDAYHLEIAELVLRRRAVRGMFLYLPGQDIVLGSPVTQREGEEHDTGQGPGRLGSALRLVSAQEILLSELDHGLQGLIAGLSEDDLLVLLADPGRFFREEKGERARGRMFLFGKRVGRVEEREEVSELDVAPTLLALAGLPVAADLPGRAVSGLREVVTGPLGVGSVPTFGDRPESVPGSEGADEVLERLRSLGYIR